MDQISGIHGSLIWMTEKRILVSLYFKIHVIEIRSVAQLQKWRIGKPHGARATEKSKESPLYILWRHDYYDVTTMTAWFCAFVRSSIHSLLRNIEYVVHENLRLWPFPFLDLNIVLDWLFFRHIFACSIELVTFTQVLCYCHICQVLFYYLLIGILTDAQKDFLWYSPWLPFLPEARNILWGGDTLLPIPLCGIGLEEPHNNLSYGIATPNRNSYVTGCISIVPWPSWLRVSLRHLYTLNLFHAHTC